MSFLKKIARDIAGDVGQSASRAARNSIGSRIAPAAPPRQVAPPPPPPQQAPVAPPPVQSQPARSEGMLEGAFAGLVGSAERFIDKMGTLIGVCPNCQAPGTANTACEQCGTHVPPSTAPTAQEPGATAPSAGPANCDNCGARIQGSVCGYCAP